MCIRDSDRVIPDKSLSIAEGVIRPFQTGFARECQSDLLRFCQRADIDIDCPFEQLPPEHQRLILEGECKPDQSPEQLWQDGLWYGVKGFFQWLESKTYKMHVRILLSRYRAYRPCPTCNGGRYGKDTLNYRLPTTPPLSLPQLSSLPVQELLPLLQKLPLPPNDRSTQLIAQQILTRLSYLEEVGLGYLSLDRPSRTLSGGEMERVNLTTCLGASLVNTLFVLDEPTVGLHPRDTSRLASILRRLRDNGNTLLVVEHDESIIRNADFILDIGPGGGSNGGQLLYAGPVDQLQNCSNSLTANYLIGKKSIPLPKKRRKPTGWITLNGITHNNLHRLDVRFPLGVLCCVTGVSGSGKSSLVVDVLYANLEHDPSKEIEAPGFCRDLSIDGPITRAILVDQSPIGRTPRSTPAVYIGIFDHIRTLFANTSYAQQNKLSPSFFSFNSQSGGRCPRCQGLGFEKVEMQFLSDIYLRCPECNGSRYQKSALACLLNGKSIADVLNLTTNEAISFFSSLDTKNLILPPLQLLSNLGLGYLRLGQPLHTLSGGEAQRLKLASNLLDPHYSQSPEEFLFILDEPTTGLHFDDVRLLLNTLNLLVQKGSSVIVVEHNLDVIKSADYILDLGPEAGSKGGKIVAQGTPESVANSPSSITAQFLAQLLTPKHPKHASSSPHPPQPDPPTHPSHPYTFPPNSISVRGARHHNLKNLDLDIPRDRKIVITGPSGSGKSSLAFDILFAEGQRRFLDSMSPYARQFVQQLERPDVDHVAGLPPTVAIEQRLTRGGAKSTVATITEIYHFLRLLFAKLGTQFCPDCNLPVKKNTFQSVFENTSSLLASGPVEVFAPIVRSRKGLHLDAARKAERLGFQSLLIDGRIYPISAFPRLDRWKEHSIDIFIGNFSSGQEKQLEKALQQAFHISQGFARVRDSAGNFHLSSTELNCPGCNRSFDELDPRLFSFNSPLGWCNHCRGFGEIWNDSPQKNQGLSLAEQELEEERRYESLAPDEAFLCPICKGTRLNEIALAVRLQNLNIAQVCALSVRNALHWIQNLNFSNNEALIARDILPEIHQRLQFLEEVGLGYISLNRGAKTLSGGESQRIRLAAQLGSNLRGVLYVLDEPTIGLHPADNRKLLSSLTKLADKGNSLLIVEHDEETMRLADHIIDLGPGAGQNGGQVVAQGTLSQILASNSSVTGHALKNPIPHPLRGSRRNPNSFGWLKLYGATKHNLQNVNLHIPIGCLTVVSGVSGSGKSSLIRGVLLPALQQKLSRSKTKLTPKQNTSWSSIEGSELLAAVSEMDQSPIGKTSRSTPATYVKLFDEIRKLFANLPDARLRGYSASRFSFNTEGGRCETCQGQGIIKLEMSFLPTATITCEDCNGRRFNDATLEILYNGKSIADILNMTISEASDFFANVPKISRTLNLLKETGLGYLRLGQPSPTLSGGEAQRIKLVAELAAHSTPLEREILTGRKSLSTLYILEEPTIGLHASDVANLILLLHKLVDQGATIIVIEHHLDIIAEADWIVELGPGAGENGGKIICSGTPEQVIQNPNSITAPFLVNHLNLSHPQPTQKQSPPTPSFNLPPQENSNKKFNKIPKNPKLKRRKSA
ncbi:MAG: excinuclease ABC subunit UvrA, partial [Chthoniobacterales bacterium]|nr:excinuclease ABC subunit UvrA [Chthoniobacterales bacterium]